MKRQGVFPFTAIIGQEEMKKALILNVVNPRLGGVLIQGEKGPLNLRLSVHWRIYYRRGNVFKDAITMTILKIKQTGVTAVTNYMTPKNLQ